MSRNNKSRKDEGRRGGRVRSLVDGSLLLAGLALAVACGALEVLGPRPVLAADALWVGEHRSQVQVVLCAVALAVFASIPPLLVRGKRPLVLLMWITAGAMLAVRYWERVAIVGDVMKDAIFG